MLLIKTTLAIMLFSLTNVVAEKSIEISKSERKIRIKDHGVTLSEYACAFGKGGDGAKVKRGDNKTPEGEYQVLAINRKSGYHIFLHLSYPNLSDIEKAKSAGLITDSAYSSLAEDMKQGRPIPQNTVLGGQVGIHGLKNGMGWLGRFHLNMDWTQGCIAVTNPEIEEIAAQVKVGTKVTIRN
jgi:murein L,D-transpeptidase YafK